MIINELKRIKFNKNLVLPCFPVIIEGLFDQHWLNSLNYIGNDFKNLLNDDRTNNLLVPIELQSGYEENNVVEIPFSLFINLFILNRNKISEVGYLTQFDLINQSPFLSTLFPTNDYIAALKPRSNTWIGPQNTLTSLHRDANTESNLFLQLIGQKRVNLIHPSFKQNLYLHSNNSTLRNHSKFKGELPTREDLKTYPLMDDVEVATAVLNPFDSLFIPANYFHSFKSLCNSFSINYWFKSD